MSAPNSTRKRSPRGLRVNGRLLAFLRKGCNLSQEVAASQIGLSDKLIRRAEASEILQSTSIHLLAAFYGLPGAAVVTPESYWQIKTVSASQPTTPSHILVGLLYNVWNEASGKWTAPPIAERATLDIGTRTIVGSSEVMLHFENVRKSLGPAFLAINDVGNNNDLASCRWTLFRFMQAAALTMRTGNTSIRVKKNRIVEIWDYWDPQHRAT